MSEWAKITDDLPHGEALVSCSEPEPLLTRQHAFPMQPVAIAWRLEGRWWVRPALDAPAQRLWFDPDIWTDIPARPKPVNW